MVDKAELQRRARQRYTQMLKKAIRTSRRRPRACRADRRHERVITGQKGRNDRLRREFEQRRGGDVGDGARILHHLRCIMHQHIVAVPQRRGVGIRDGSTVNAPAEALRRRAGRNVEKELAQARQDASADAGVRLLLEGGQEARDQRGAVDRVVDEVGVPHEHSHHRRDLQPQLIVRRGVRGVAGGGMRGGGGTLCGR